MAGPISSYRVKTGTRQNVKAGVEKVVKLIVLEYNENTGKEIPPRFAEFLTAFIWSWIDFADNVALHRGKIDPKDAGLYAVKHALLAVGLIENEYADCGVALASATVTLVDNWGLIVNTARLSAASIEIPALSAALAAVSLGAAISVGYDFLEAKGKCEPIIRGIMKSETNYKSKLAKVYVMGAAPVSSSVDVSALTVP